LRRVRWAVRATLALGVAASVVANILHAQDNPISQAIAAWPPLALLLTVELISRVPVHRRSLALARWAATATIAGIAAWVSYWHMAGVAARYGETGASPYLLPLSVDGLIVVASICLVELGGRISAATEADPHTGSRAGSTQPRETLMTGPPAKTAGRTAPAQAASSTSVTAGPTASTPARSRKPAKSSGSSARPRRPVAETAALAAAIEAARPQATEAEIADELGITPARLRTVRRQVRELETAA